MSATSKVQSPYYQVAQCNPKTPIVVSSKRQVSSEKAKKGYMSALVTATTSIHLPTSVATGLKIQIQFQLNQQEKMGCNAG